VLAKGYKCEFEIKVLKE